MKKFTKNNQSFVCVKCKADVSKHPKSSRDHCNYCLYGLHVDIYPGDRLNKCRGILKPIGLEMKDGKTKIIFRCQKCNKLLKNITAPDDNFEEILLLSSKKVSI